MPTEIRMQKLSDTMEVGTLLKWHKKPGDTVEFDDELADVETDKATMALTAPEDGILHAIYVEEGAKVPVGAPVALILEEGEEPPPEGSVPAAAPAESSAPAEEESASAAPAATPAATTTADGSRIKASPLARKIAAEKGIDLTSIKGTGPNGRIVKKDLEGASAAPASAAASTAPAAPSVPAIRPTAGAGDQRIPLTGMRTIIAQRLLESKTRIPHFYLNIEVDAAPLLTLRKQINATANEGGPKFTVNDFVLKAIVNAAAAVPAVNASFDGDAIVQFASVNLSVAIAVEDGLVTPVIRDAQTKSLPEISAAVKDLAERARNKRLSPDEFSGGTITVSNLGAYGIDNFDAIINPPQAAILSIGAAKAKPVVNESGEIVVGQRMWVGMSCDHRVVDGAIGATYLAAFKKLIENPALMLV
ncbi:MAG: pyruvate dehydrogenase E2 component (dihydrolipoamide acetyltransferase) [Verrucomicrobiales bacterium]|jgi:pyruvate dehydrogenase E2 component (dihydrolipoamide acetyltransferase)